MTSIERHLSASQLLGYLKRLGSPSKHLETLVECCPLLVLNNPVEVAYEVQGLGQGNRTIDWKVRTKHGLPILLDVKCRIRELIKKMPMTGIPDPQFLFSGLPEKFRDNSTAMCLQGGWIHSVIKYNLGGLREAFEKTDSRRLHFTVLASWNNQAYVLARSKEIEDVVRTAFNLPDDDSIVVK